MKKLVALILLLFASSAFSIPLAFTWDDTNPGVATTFELTTNGVVNSGIVGNSKLVDVPIIPGGVLDAKVRAFPPAGYQCGDPPVACPNPTSYALLAALLPADPINTWATRTRTGGSTMAAPTFVGVQSLATPGTAVANGGSKTTPNVSVQTGDLLVVSAATEDSPDTLAITSTPSLTWTLQQTYTSANDCATYLWTATANATGNQSATLTINTTGGGGGSKRFGGNLQAWRGSGFGNSAKSQGSGAPTLNLTTTQADSAIVLIDADWAAVTGTVTPRTNAGAFTQVDNYSDGANYGLHTGYHADSGATNTYAIGYTAPSTQTYSLIGIEVKGSSSGANLTGSSVAQADNSSTGAVTQTQTITGSNGSQANGSSIGAVTETQTITGSSVSQSDTSSTGAVTQTKTLTGGNVSQADTSSTGAVTQTQTITGSNASQADTSSTGAITSAGTLTASNVAQVNSSSTGAITETQTITGSNASQADSSTTAAITQTKTLTGSNVSQADSSSIGAIASGGTVLTGTSVGQSNTSSTGTISQTHILTADSIVQINNSPGGGLPLGLGIWIPEVGNNNSWADEMVTTSWIPESSPNNGWLQ